MTQQVVPAQSAQPTALDEEAIKTLRRTIAAGLNANQFDLFVAYCRRTGLDPFQHQIHAYQRGDRLIMQVGIDGLRLIAARTGELEGYEGPQWAGEDGIWRDVWLSQQPPAVARVGVWRKGFRAPVWGVAHYTEFVQRREGKPTAIWMSMPANQLAKCAEAQALRRAFPAEAAGLYVPEEAGAMDHVDEAIAERRQNFRPVRDTRVDAPADTPPVIEGEVVKEKSTDHKPAAAPAPAPKTSGPVQKPEWLDTVVAMVKAEGYPPVALSELIGDNATVKNLAAWGATVEDPIAEVRRWLNELIAKEQGTAESEDEPLD